MGENSKKGGIPLRFRSSLNSKNKPILQLIEGPMQDFRAEEVGLLQHVDEKNPQNEYFYYEHPRNIAAVDNMKAVLEKRGYKPDIEIIDGQGQDVTGLLLPRQLQIYKSQFRALFGGDISQCGPKIYRQATKLIAEHHPHLAGAAILYVFEDYDAKEMAMKKFGHETGETWGFAKVLGGAFKEMTGYNFKVTLCLNIWNHLTGPEKRALLDHELCHCGRRPNGSWFIKPHDIEDFREIIERHPGSRITADTVSKVQAAILSNRNPNFDGEE